MLLKHFIISRITVFFLLFLTLVLSPFSGNSENWVRIAVKNSGVYSLSYAQLNEMGFQDPRKVGVLGLGGKNLEVENIELNIFDLQAPVYHNNDRLFFYASGIDDFTFIENFGSDYYGYFHNNGLNINSEFGYYYLSDQEGVAVQIPEYETKANDNKLADAIAFVSHENDITHNSTDTGKLFWGEKFNGSGSSKHTWKVDLSGAMPNATALFDFVFYQERDLIGSIKIGSSAGSVIIDNLSNPETSISPLGIPVQKFPISNGAEEITMEYNCPQNTIGIANLDQWVLSYPVDLSRPLSSLDKKLALIFNSNTSHGFIPLETSQNLQGFDITFPDSPVLLKRDESSQGFLLDINGYSPIVTFFDASNDANAISSWQPLANSPVSNDLSASVSEGASLIIVTVPELVECANLIAYIHREYDGISSLIVTPEEIYAGFSAGLPDPEAYRRFIRAVYTQGKIQPQNVLLLGPLTNDNRTFERNHGYASAHIIPQASDIQEERGAYPLIDYFVVVEKAPVQDAMERETLDLGIGILPFLSLEEGLRYVDKMREYLESPSHASCLNEWLLVGGTGDQHTHDGQCVTLSQTIENVSQGKVMTSILAVDEYGEPESKSRLMSYINDGKGMVVYFGHSGNTSFGKNSDVFSAEDVKLLHNAYLPFLITAGCSATHSDIGKRGLGEEWILGTKAGAIGGIISQRETWSSQNFDFVTAFLSACLQPSDLNFETVGDLFRMTKNSLNGTNENALSLMCDPALKIVLPGNFVSFKTDAEITPSGNFEIEGYVSDRDGNTLSAFNGMATVKLVEPGFSKLCDELETAGDNNGVTLTVHYQDRVVTEVGAEVKNGYFKASLAAPEYLKAFTGRDASVYVSCYDAESGQSASGMVRRSIAKSPLELDRDADMIPPVIENLYYDYSSGLIEIYLSDDRGLDLSSSPNAGRPFIVTLDGIKSEYLYPVARSVEDNGKRANLICRLPSLGMGAHSFSISVADRVGNRAEKSLEFFVNPAGDLSLELVETAVSEAATFLIDNAGTNTSIYIVNSAGNIIRILVPLNGKVEWDCRDENGQRVDPGLYKAFAADSKTSEGVRRHSTQIHVPVI